MGDSDNFTYTPEEKEDALTEAIRNDYVRKEEWADFVYSTGTYQYPLPAGVTVVADLYIKPDNNADEPQKIDSNLWEVVKGNIHMKQARRFIQDGYTIYVKGHDKYADDDSIAEESLQEYILNLAQLKLLRMLGVKKSLRFLKNDTSMAEIVAIKRELEAEVREYRRRQPTAWEVS